MRLRIKFSPARGALPALVSLGPAASFSRRPPATGPQIRALYASKAGLMAILGKFRNNCVSKLKGNFA